MIRTLSGLAAALVTAVLTAAVVIPATPVFADPRGGGTQKVSHVNLDLGRDAGMKTLQSRIEAAIVNVCGDDTSPSARSVIARCKTTARADVARQIAQAAFRLQLASIAATNAGVTQ